MNRKLMKYIIIGLVACIFLFALPFIVETKSPRESELYTLAMLKLNDLVSTGYWSHDNSDGCTFMRRAEKYLVSNGGKYVWIGENIYHGVCNKRSAYKSWESSPSHKEILDHYSDEEVLVSSKSNNNECYYVLIKGQLDK